MWAKAKQSSRVRPCYKCKTDKYVVVATVGDLFYVRCDECQQLGPDSKDWSDAITGWNTIQTDWSFTGCNQCQALMINGVFCHESGCPNRGKIWDGKRQAWIQYVECWYCGYDVELGTACDCREGTE